MADQRLAWLFPGQGAQFTGMGRDLFEGSSAARRVYETADDVLGYAVTNDCFEGPEAHLQQTEFAQPALYVTSFACLEAAREFNSLPEQPPAFFAGHSLGEYTALAAAGAVGFEDGLRLVQERGRLMQQAAAQQPGAMAALLGLDEAAVHAICEETGAELCNLNAPGQIVIGGGSDAIEAAVALALERGARRGVMLKVSGAFHTSHMAPAAESMARAVANTTFHDPQAPVIANTSAEPMTNAAELAGEVGLDVGWDIGGGAHQVYLVPDHVHHAAAAQSLAFFLVDESNRYGDGQPRGGAHALEVDVQRHVGHRVELYLARQDPMAFAVDLDLQKRGEKARLYDLLIQSMRIERDRRRLLVVAVNYPGHAAGASRCPRTALADPLPGLGQHRCAITHRSTPRTVVDYLGNAGSQSNRLDTDRDSAIRRIASDSSGAMVSCRMLFAWRTASVA